jgi:hypothetical protein
MPACRFLAKKQVGRGREVPWPVPKNCHAPKPSFAPSEAEVWSMSAGSRVLFTMEDLTHIAGPLAAQMIYPIDRAAILAGARFDFKVEFPVIENPADLRITIDGEDYRRQSGQFVENEDGLRMPCEI